MGLITASVPTTTRLGRIGRARRTRSVAALKPSLTVTRMWYVPSCMGFQAKLLLGPKSRTTWDWPLGISTLNW